MAVSLFRDFFVGKNSWFLKGIEVMADENIELKEKKRKMQEHKELITYII